MLYRLRQSAFLLGTLCRLAVAGTTVLTIGTSAYAATDLPDGAVLERVVLVARHGIRSPTQSTESLTLKTGRTWSVWPVPPGSMTEHGRTNLALMATFLRTVYAPLIATPGKPLCTPATSPVFVWADSADARTLETGTIFARVLSRGCVLAPASLPAGKKDPLFNAMANGPVVLDQTAITRTLTALFLKDDAGALPPAVHTAEQTLQHLFAPQGCNTPHTACFTAPAQFGWKKGAPHATGGLVLSASVAENLLLEYVQGLPPTVTAQQGQADLLATILPAHTYQSQRLRRLPALAAARGQLLLPTLLDLLSSAPSHTVPPSARLILFAGHDTTLDMLASLFGLEWHFTDQPDPTAPDTTLGLEVWRVPGQQPMMRFVLFHQSLAQLRMATPVTERPDGGAAMVLHSSLCPTALCSLAELTSHFSSKPSTAPL
ncbi:MAG: histidine-type phosphatase [Acetobacter cibinongensis]